MNQKTPNISDTDIKRLIRREFPNKLISKIEAILKQYVSGNQKGRNRVYASILKLSNGNIDDLAKNVEQANNDFRDIISRVEYPNYSKYVFEKNLTDEQEKQLIQKDWEQFKSWFDKE